MKKMLVITVLLVFCVYPVMGQAHLRIDPADIIIEQASQGGYHLWIRKKQDISSVLLTESSADPEKRLHSYSLRAPQYNEINGDEKRILDGVFLDTTKGIYSLVDSTVEQHPLLGAAFHIYIPFVVIYGYSWSRMGEIQVVNGTFLNIRAFSKPYADYSGAYFDNPFEMQIIQKPFSGPREEAYIPEALEELRVIARNGKGQALVSIGEEDVLEKIDTILHSVPEGSLDLVLAIDTTKSMENDIEYVKKGLVKVVSDSFDRFQPIRVGILYYRDYFELYMIKTFSFSDDIKKIQKTINSAQVHGGTDTPEAVYEALYEALHKYQWQAEHRIIILIGDAPPHPRPRGKVTADMVFKDAENMNVIIHTIILPQ
ncbi:MAG: VWA domain-containing protein [Spirochaetales bacterium]|nr:VWA domain-containing protein [Spirochaetales bacterium]